MRHNMNELYDIYFPNGSRKIATYDYVIANNIEIAKTSLRRYEDNPTFAVRCRSKVGTSKPKKALDVNGIKLIYMFGEKTWFDTEEELNECKEEYNKERNEIKAKKIVRDKIIALLDDMSVEEVENFYIEICKKVLTK